MGDTGDYISREAAMRLIDRYWQQAYNAHFLDAAVRLGSVYREMEDIPAADVREVVRGKWLVGTYGRVHHICSRCKFDYFSTHTSNFCPNCGADMREKS